MYKFCRKVSLWDWKNFLRKENCQRKQCLIGSTKTCQIWESAFSDFYCYDNYLFIHLWKMLIFSDNGVQGTRVFICYEGYNDEKKCPRLLSCGHSFCFSCLERLLHGNSIDCPKCRHAVTVPTGVQGLLKNFALLDIVKEAPNWASWAYRTYRHARLWGLWWETPRDFLLLGMQRKFLQNCGSVS